MCTSESSVYLMNILCQLGFLTHSSSCQSMFMEALFPLPLHLACEELWSLRRTTRSVSGPEGEDLEAMNSGRAALRAWMAVASSLLSHTVTSCLV